MIAGDGVRLSSQHHFVLPQVRLDLNYRRVEWGELEEAAVVRIRPGRRRGIRVDLPPDPCGGDVLRGRLYALRNRYFFRVEGLRGGFARRCRFIEIQPVLIAPRDGGDANYVLAAIEQTGIDENCAGSFRTGVDYEPVYFAQTLATNSEHRCAEFDLHSGPFRIVVRDASPGF